MIQTPGRRASRVLRRILRRIVCRRHRGRGGFRATEARPRAVKLITVISVACVVQLINNIIARTAVDRSTNGSISKYVHMPVRFGSYTTPRMGHSAYSLHMTIHASRITPLIHHLFVCVDS